MTKPTPHTIVDSAIDATIQSFAHGLSDQVPQLSHLFADAFQRRGNSIVATLITPTGDAGPSAAHIRERLQERLKKQVVIRQKKDPSLIGGAILQVGSQRIDMSVRGALRRISEHISHPQA